MENRKPGPRPVKRDVKPVGKEMTNRRAVSKPAGKAKGKISVVKNKTITLIRLNRFIANSGVCSRRDADEHIKNGLVSVNGRS